MNLVKRFLKNLLEKIICTVQEKGEVGNTVAFALLTAGIAPAFVIALTKSIREKKINNPSFYDALRIHKIIEKSIISSKKNKRVSIN